MPNVDESLIVGVSFPVEIFMKGKEFRIDRFKKGPDPAGITGVVIYLFDGNGMNRRHRNA